MASSNPPTPDAELRQFADAMPQIVWIAKADGFVEFFNRHWCDYTGFTTENADGDRWQATLHPDDRQRTIEQWCESLNSGGGYEAEYRIRAAADGQYRWFIGRALPHRDVGGKIFRWFGTCTDIHDRKIAEETLRLAKEQSDRNSRSKDEFLSILSHELRTPLSAILGWVQLLEMGVLDEKEAKDAVITIRDQAKVQSQLIEDLLEVSRIINGKFHMRQEPVPLTAVLDRTLQTVAPSAADKRVTIERREWDTSIQIMGDAQRIGQLAWNLLTNAVKFTPAGGKIILECKANLDMAVLNVCDTGKGIDSEQLARIFENFSQVDSTATRAQGGLGLGLSIVRHIVRMHRGTIQAKSKGLECGTEFIVMLPLLKAPLPTDFGAPQKPISPGVLYGLRLLVVDDEDSARTIAAASLAKFGADVHTVSTAVEAESLLQPAGGGFDVLISDIGMPEVSGLDLIRLIRAAPLPLGRLPAIALTAFASVDDQSQALDAGFSAHVSKPLDVVELVRHILRLVGR